MRRKGFTLVEMLVVIGILALLAGVLFSVTSRARERGRIATCTSNMYQIHLAQEMYKQDYDNEIISELRELYPTHLKDKRLLVCPNDAFVAQGGWEWVGWQSQGIPPADGRPPQSYPYVFLYNLPNSYRYPGFSRAESERISETAGYLVCQLHGELKGSSATSPKGEEFPTVYKGLTLRLRRDGSVHTAFLPKNNSHVAFFHDYLK